MTLLNRHTTLLIVFIASTLCATAQTVEFVANIKPTGKSIVYNNKLFLLADSGSIRGGLWSTDGTTAGTGLVKSIDPYAISFSPKFTLLNNKLYFSADDGTNGVELWETDGTTAGTPNGQKHSPGRKLFPKQYYPIEQQTLFQC
jgi:ELWxxDGT repeat protein